MSSTTGTVETFECSRSVTTVLVSGQDRYVTRTGGCALLTVWWVDEFPRQPALDRACVHEQVGRQSLGSGLPDRKQGTSRERAPTPVDAVWVSPVEVQIDRAEHSDSVSVLSAGVINYEGQAWPDSAHHLGRWAPVPTATGQPRCLVTGLRVSRCPGADTTYPASDVGSDRGGANGEAPGGFEEVGRGLELI